MNYDDLGPDLAVTSDGGIRTLTLDVPDKRNAFTEDLQAAMTVVWDRLMDDEGARAVVLTGAGDIFSSGGDVVNFPRHVEHADERRRAIRRGERLARAMLACELPIVAAVNGPAVGLGATVALLSDIVVIAQDAFMADPHVSVGLVAGDGGVVTWPFHTSMLRAKEYLLLGDRVPAEECLRLGLANRVVPTEEVRSTASDLAERLAAQPRQAVRDTKRALNLHLLQAANLTLPFALAAEGESFTTEDVRERAERFLARDGRS